MGERETARSRAFPRSPENGTWVPGGAALGSGTVVGSRSVWSPSPVVTELTLGGGDAKPVLGEGVGRCTACTGST
jgi:hypothetical protein